MLDVAAVTLSPRMPSVSVPLVVARGNVDEPEKTNEMSQYNKFIGVFVECVCIGRYINRYLSYLAILSACPII